MLKSGRGSNPRCFIIALGGKIFKIVGRRKSGALLLWEIFSTAENAEKVEHAEVVQGSRAFFLGERCAPSAHSAVKKVWVCSI
jgi:hypothetical protein